MFFSKKKSKKESYVLKIQFLKGANWCSVTRDLDEGTTIEQVQALAYKADFQIKNSGKVDIGGAGDCLRDTYIFLAGITNATVDIIEQPKGD